MNNESKKFLTLKANFQFLGLVTLINHLMTNDLLMQHPWFVLYLLIHF